MVKRRFYRSRELSHDGVVKVTPPGSGEARDRTAKTWASRQVGLNSNLAPNCSVVMEPQARTSRSFHYSYYRHDHHHHHYILFNFNIIMQLKRFSLPFLSFKTSCIFLPTPFQIHGLFFRCDCVLFLHLRLRGHWGRGGRKAGRTSQTVSSSSTRSYIHKDSPARLAKDKLNKGNTAEHAKADGRKPTRLRPYKKNYGQLSKAAGWETWYPRQGSAHQSVV